MSVNKYVDFVSDEYFLDCVKWVIDAYVPASGNPDMKDLEKNTVDPFKIIFDCSIKSIGVNAWVKDEEIRQLDKTINNRIGEFHQKLLGGTKDWIDLGTGDEDQVDLKKTDNSIFIELKNKFNTVNSSSLASLRQKLEKIVKKYPETNAHWAFIFSKKGDSGEEIWKQNGNEHPRIYKTWGNKVYELVTGDSNALENTWKILPKAIADLNKETRKFTDEDLEKLNYFFNSAFK